MMKKNMLIRKRHFVSMAMLCVALGISGCGSQLTVENYTHEAGEALPEEAAAYVDFKNTDQKEAATVDLSKVDPKKVGSYEAVIVLDEKEYPFTVDVVDTKAPEGTFQQLVVACGIDQTVIPEWFECSGTDASEFQYGIRKAELLKTAEELKEIIQANIKEAEDAGVEQLMIRDLAGVTWNEETDTWDEFGVSADELKSEFVPEEEGLWRLEMLSVDEYGNANVFYCYVIADLEAPEYDMGSELEITSPSQFDIDDYMKRLQEKMQAKDNLLGDISDKVDISEVDFVKEYDDYNEVKVSSSITDLAGNVTKEDHIFKVYNAKQTVSSSQGVGSVYGPKLTQAELDEVAGAVQSFLANYITEGMTDYQKVRAANDFLCNTVSYADSWAYNGANTAWGALIYHEAQCSGFARAMKALCDGMGVGCYYVHSSTTSHQWNEVCVDGNWYIIDVTANATAGNGSAFLISEANFVNFWNGQGYAEDWNRSSVPACPNNY